LLDTNFLAKNPDVIALNLTPGQNPNVYFPGSLEMATNMKNTLLTNTRYSLKKYGEELYIFSRK
ncbi:MAG: hypothetical protein ABUT20_53260, partial [Bacteroidota bacterium]